MTERADWSPPTCDRCYQAWLRGSNDFAPDCISGCGAAYEAWWCGETVQQEIAAVVKSAEEEP